MCYVEDDAALMTVEKNKNIYMQKKHIGMITKAVQVINIVSAHRFTIWVVAN